MSDTHHDAHAHSGPRSFWTRYVFATDHKVIGMQFTFTALLFVIVGGLLALGVRYQIAWPNQHAPHHAILPGSVLPEDTEGPRMTARVDEPNPALWKIGGAIELAENIEDRGTTYPKGTRGTLASFPRGLAVTVPQRAIAKERRLSDSVDGFVDSRIVIGDYDYTQLTPQVRTSAGVRVEVEVPEEGEQAFLTIEAMAVPRPDGFTDRDSKNILLTVRVEATPIRVEVPAQTVGEGEEAVEVSAAPILLTAANVTYPIQQLTTDGYLTLFTMHASIMIFFVIIPMLVGGFGNFLIPLMIGARDMAFPRINMLSYWFAIPTGALMIASFWVSGGAAGGGWTMYPPLSRNPDYMQSTMGTHLWVFAVGIVGFSSIVGALNYITTIINMRAPGMSMFRMPLTVWALFITAILQLFATPVLTAAMILLLFDRTLGTMFFAPVVDGTPVGGQPLLFQHLFWFYSHPAVYIMILPAMGITSDILAAYARKPIFGYKPMVFAISAIAGLGFIVWGHHMFQSGMNPTLATTFMASTIMIAVPSAIKVFNWLGTIWGGDIRFTPAMLNALGFVSMFTIGGLSGIFMASTPVDIQIHDTYFIVAHIHYVLFGGSIFGIFAGIYHWYPKMFGRDMNHRWGVIHFILTIIAFNGTFFVMHILGVGGQPRRYASNMEFPSLQHMQPLNVIMTLWALSLGLAQIPFFYNFFTSLPRRLGRAVVSGLAIVAIVPSVIGYLYWTGTPWEAGQGAPTIDLSSAAAARNWVGYVAMIGALVVLFAALLRNLPRGGRIAAFLILVPLILCCLSIVKRAATGALANGIGQSAHNLLVGAGFGVATAVVIVGIVFVIWWVGGALRLPWLLQRLLYVVFLPAFLAPWVLKPDMYILSGLPGLLAYKWLILVLLAVPGLLYLVVRRPRDEFGARAEINPQRLNTLEWIAESPPAHINFETIPTVYRGPYEYSSPVVEEDYLPQNRALPAGVVEPSGH